MKLNKQQNKQVSVQTTLHLAQTKSQEKFWEKLQPINRVATTDTYKRTMADSLSAFNNHSAYNLAARRPIKEEGADGRMIMAGLENLLYPWFSTPISHEEVEEAQSFFETQASVQKFPAEAWQEALDNEGYMPIDIWALPGGQTFLAKDGKHVPIMSVEGPGALVSHLEPHLETGYTGIIQATKARLMKEVVGEQFAEFGLRSSTSTNTHIPLMAALYVGGGFRNTSNDQAVMLFPEYFDDIGTIGHEGVMAYQRADITLEQAQHEALSEFVANNQSSALLPDVVSTLHSGFPKILELVKAHPDKDVKPRLDSGDVVAQAVKWADLTKEHGIHTKIVVEDGYNPTKARETLEAYEAAGHNPLDIIVGAGGYFQDGCTRDAISLAYKRSMTEHDGVYEPQLKFSDSPGKESIPGQVRIYGRDDTLIVAQAGEDIEGEFLMKKVVENGRILYDEDLHMQRDRAEATWNQYTSIEYSPRTQALIDRRLEEKNSLLEDIAQN